MILLFDARVLTHKNYTGIENYTKNILEYIKDKLGVRIAKPETSNKYIAHLWIHFILPFKKGDILFSPANISPLFVPKSKKLVLTIHDVAFLIYPETFSKLFYKYYSFVISYNIKRANKIITISKTSKNEILKLFPDIENKITIIPLGIDKKYRTIQDIKKKNQILYVGSINERKNLKGVIEAFELLSQELGEYKLVIVGSFFTIFSLSDEMQGVLIRAKKNNSIIFKQSLDDEALIYEYNISKLFIFPSFYEGFGLPPLEAMACGTPVITSNISSMPEVCGNAALYVDPYSIKDIADKMKILIENKSLREEMISRGLKRVKNFTWKKSAKEHIKVFEEVFR